MCFELKSVIHANNGNATSCDIAMDVMILPTYCLKSQSFVARTMKNIMDVFIKSSFNNDNDSNMINRVNGKMSIFQSRVNDESADDAL